jgi:hypothetical protein
LEVFPYELDWPYGVDVGEPMFRNTKIDYMCRSPPPGWTVDEVMKIRGATKVSSTSIIFPAPAHYASSQLCPQVFCDDPLTSCTGGEYIQELIDHIEKWGPGSLDYPPVELEEYRSELERVYGDIIKVNWQIKWDFDFGDLDKVCHLVVVFVVNRTLSAYC